MGGMIYYPLVVAQEFGILPAIILNDLKYLCDAHAKAGSDFHDGKVWCYESVESIRLKIGKVSRRQVEKALKVLEEAQLVITGQYSQNWQQRSKWYALTEKGYAFFSLEEDDVPDLPTVSKSGNVDLLTASESISPQWVNTIDTPYSLPRHTSQRESPEPSDSAELMCYIHEMESRPILPRQREVSDHDGI